MGIRAKNKKLIGWAILIAFILFALFTLQHKFSYKQAQGIVDTGEVREVMVTGYNTVPEQTDDTPCVAANGQNICGLPYNTAACPSDISFGSLVVIDGIEFTCVDRTAERFGDRFDINCDKNFACPFEHTGWHSVRIFKKHD